MKENQREKLRDASVESLRERLLERSKDLFHLRMQLVAGSLQKTDELRKTRREIARLKTYLTLKHATA